MKIRRGKRNELQSPINNLFTETLIVKTVQFFIPIQIETATSLEITILNGQHSKSVSIGDEKPAYI